MRKLLELRLWPGSLWAALSDDPSKNSFEQPRKFQTNLFIVPQMTFGRTAIDTTLSPALLISDAVQRSSVAHLFHFYPVLCEIASIPRKTPHTWVLPQPKPPTGNSASKVGGGVNGRVGSGAAVDGDTQDERAAKAIELDARVLARECLKMVGAEMGSR